MYPTRNPVGEYGALLKVGGLHDVDPLLTDDTSEAQFSRLYRAAYRPVRRYLARTLGADEADDVAAEVFTTVWERWDVAPQDADARYAWVFGVAHFKVRETIRARQRRRVIADRIGMSRSDEVVRGPEDFVIALDRVRQILDLLPSAERSAVELTVLGDLTSKQAAQILGCSVSAVTTRVGRARARLARLFRDKEGGAIDA